VTLIRSYSARFAGVVYPGDTLRISIWSEDDRLLVTASTVERGDPVLADGILIARSGVR
jgi:acyl dehydratase